MNPTSKNAIKIWPSEVEKLRDAVEEAMRMKLSTVELESREKGKKFISMWDASAILALAEVSFSAGAEYILFDLKS